MGWGGGFRKSKEVQNVGREPNVLREARLEKRQKGEEKKVHLGKEQAKQCGCSLVSYCVGLGEENLSTSLKD